MEEEPQPGAQGGLPGGWCQRSWPLTGEGVSVQGTGGRGLCSSTAACVECLGARPCAECPRRVSLNQQSS